MKRAFAALALTAALLASCDNPQKTVDSLRRELREFKAAPDETKQAKIEADLQNWKARSPYSSKEAM
jgi:hypothetical protein